MAISETITVDAGPAISQLDALSAAADKAAAAMERIGKSAAGGGGADKLAASMAAAADRIEAASQRAAAAMGRMSTAARSATGGLDTVGASADRAAAGTDKVATSADAAAAALDRQAAAGKRAGESVAAAGAGAGGGKLKEWALGAALILGYAADKAIKFQGSMELLHTQAGVTQAGVDKLSTGVLKLAGVTGQSPGNLAESMYHVASNMASMPGTTYAQMLNVVEMAAKGASIGHSNLVDTTNALTSVVASGIKGSKDYSQAMGMLNATVGSGDMTMQQLAESMASGLVPVVKGYGLTLKDVGAGLATFGDLNIRGAHAGTYLKMAVQALAVPMKTAPLKEFGLTMDTLSNDMQKGGLIKALDDLNARFHKAGLTAATEGPAITALFGKKAGAGLSVLMEQLDRFHSKFPVLTQDANNFNAAWAATQATPQQKLKQLEAGAQAMTITLGNIALPAANAIMGGLDKAMQFVQDHAFASKGLTLGLGTLIAGGLTKGIFSGVESGLSGLGKLGSLLKIPGMDKLANIGQTAGLDGAAAKLGGAGASLDGAAASLEGAAATMKGENLPGLLPGGKAGGLTAAEEETAVAGSLGLGKLNLGAVLAKALPAAIGVAIADSILKSIPSGKPGSGKNWFDNPFGMPGPTSPASSHNFLTSFAPYERLFNRGISQVSQMFSDPFDAIFGGGKHTPPPKDWTSVLGDTPWYGQKPAPALGINGAPSGMGARYQGLYNVQHAQQAAAQAAAAPPPPAQAPPRLIPGSGAMGIMPKLAPPDTSGLEAAKAKVQADITAINSVMSKMSAQKVKIPPPDMAAMDSAKAKLQSDLAGINAELAKVSKPSKIGAPDLSALDAAKAKAVATAGQIMSGLQAALQKVVKAAAPDISAFRGAIGPAAADGRAITGGLASGIQAGEASAVAAAHAVAAAVTAALNISLQVRSPSKVTQKIGAATVQGLIVGLQGGQPALTAAATALGQTVAKAADVTAIDAAITKAIGYAGKDSAMVRYLKAEQSKLEKLAAQRTKLETEITDSTQIAQSAVSGASILGAGAYTPALANGPTSAQTTITGMGYMAGDQTAFAASLQKLAKMGLNPTSLSQLAQAGASQGLPVAQGLTQGGAGSISQVNALEKTIMKGSAAVGDVGGPAMYAAGAQLGQMAASGLKSALGAVDAAMKQIGQAIVKDLDKALHIKPPAAHPSHSAQPSHGGGGGGTVHHHHQTVNVTVQGSLVAQQDLASHIQGVLLQHGSQNWQAGIIYPGRSL